MYGDMLKKLAEGVGKNIVQRFLIILGVVFGCGALSGAFITWLIMR